tara:strand:- start:488 stop:646 length:159 start_codon:yes stop_codon:yes gene_type:complete
MFIIKIFNNEQQNKSIRQKFRIPDSEVKKIYFRKFINAYALLQIFVLYQIKN